MYHEVEYNGVRKTVKASATATVTDVFAIAFGGDSWGDVRAKDMRIIRSMSRAKHIKSLIEDSGYTRSEATAIVNAGGLE